MKNKQKPFSQSLFDKAFVAAIEHLVSKENGLMNPPNRRELCAEIGIKSQFYDMKSGNRSVPKKNIDKAIEILTKKYHVSLSFLRTNEGPVLESAEYDDERLSLSHEPPGQYGLNPSNKEEGFRREVLYLKQLLAEKDRIIKLQENMLNEVQKKSEEMQDNG